MSALQDLLLSRGLLVAPSFPRRPESIFDGVEMPVTILVSRPGNAMTFTSRVGRFYTEERPHALHIMAYTDMMSTPWSPDRKIRLEIRG